MLPALSRWRHRLPRPDQPPPNHHTLVVARSDVIEVTLRDIALDALIRAMTVHDNPYQPKRP